MTRWAGVDAVKLAELRALQTRLASRVSTADELPPWREVKTVAGADVSVARGSRYAFAAIVVLDVRTWETVEIAQREIELTFPYIPGYLSFRELPVLLDCFADLRTKPDFVVCDGQGLAHPRRFGVACHLGVETGMVTIGCAKSHLVGDYTEPGSKRGAYRSLTLDGVQVGEVLCTRDGVAPLFISPGHRISFRRASRVILSLCRGVRQPEPIRAAHTHVNLMRKASPHR